MMELVARVGSYCLGRDCLTIRMQPHPNTLNALRRRIVDNQPIAIELDQIDGAIVRVKGWIRSLIYDESGTFGDFNGILKDVWILEIELVQRLNTSIKFDAYKGW